MLQFGIRQLPDALFLATRSGIAFHLTIQPRSLTGKMPGDTVARLGKGLLRPRGGGHQNAYATK
jgi:hypothetical protein